MEWGGGIRIIGIPINGIRMHYSAHFKLFPVSYSGAGAPACLSEFFFKDVFSSFDDRRQSNKRIRGGIYNPS